MSERHVRDWVVPVGPVVVWELTAVARARWFYTARAGLIFLLLMIFMLFGAGVGSPAGAW